MSTKGNNRTKKKKSFQLLRGMKDILPEDQPYWEKIRHIVDTMAQAYGFGRIDTPLLEETDLFIRSVGEATDIIEKEMYTFTDKGGDSVSLRPEGTAGVVRAYIEHGMLNRSQPVKLYYRGPFFRYDRPQAGRYRQFFQFGFEAIGDNHPVIDAQLLMMAYRFYDEIGLPVSLQVNSIGTPECRNQYKKILLDYYKPRKKSLSEEDQQRLQTNPLRLLDSKDPDAQILAQDAPQIVDHLDEESHQHFVKVLEHLDELEIPYVLNPRLVRGLDYYTGTVFELWPQSDQPDDEAAIKSSAQSALGGGGRYDLLIKMLGGQATPAIGFASGIERLIMAMKERDVPKPPAAHPDVFVAQLGDAARKKSLKLFEELRQSGFQVGENFSKDGLKAQMELANKRGAKFAVILGQKEIMDNTILIRDMESGLQETVDYQRLVPELEKRLQKSNVVEKKDNS